MIEIFTTGFPRSGNTWLWRSLSDLFNAPMQEKPNMPIHKEFAEVIEDRFLIRKTHWFRHEYNGKGYNGEPSKIVLTIRDPRDVVVSQMYYRKKKDLYEAIGVITNGRFSLFIDGWMRSKPDYIVRYEEMHANPTQVLARVAMALFGMTVDENKLERVAERQKFERWHDLDTRAMRKGIVGDWKNHFDRASGRLFDTNFGQELIDLGYEQDRNWWQSLEAADGSRR